MKTLAFILLLVVLALSIAPCCALNDRINQPEEKEAAVTQEDPAQDEDCCQDCSPFYTCGACGGFMVTNLIAFGIPMPILIPTSFKSTYLYAFADGIDQNIWQPPKLS